MRPTEALVLWLKRGALALAVMALFVRAAVPAGYMIAAPAAGGLPDLVICTGHGPLKLGKDHAPARLPGGEQKDQACAFAAGPAPSPPPAAILAPAPVRLETAAPAARPAWQRPGLGLAAPPPPSQGPPALA